MGRRLSKGVEYLVEASAAEAEAISATLAAAKAWQLNGEASQLPDRDRGADATPSGKSMSISSKAPESPGQLDIVPPGVRLHHRAVCSLSYNFLTGFNATPKYSLGY